MKDLEIISLLDTQHKQCYLDYSTCDIQLGSPLVHKDSKFKVFFNNLILFRIDFGELEDDELSPYLKERWWVSVENWGGSTWDLMPLSLAWKLERTPSWNKEHVKKGFYQSKWYLNTMLNIKNPIPLIFIPKEFLNNYLNLIPLKR